MRRITTYSQAYKGMAADDLDNIKAAVERCRIEYIPQIRRFARNHDIPYTLRQDIIRKLKVDLYTALDAIEPKTMNKSSVFTLAASYAYQLDIDTWNSDSPRFQNRGTL